MSTDSETTTDSTTSNAPVAVKPPGSELARRALWAVALIPVGLVMAFVVAGILSSLMGLPLLSVGTDATSTPAQDVILMAVSLVVGLLAPLAALVFSIRAARAGHPRGWLLVATTAVILALLAAFPIVTTLASEAPPDLGGEAQSSDWSVWFMGVGPPPPSSNGVEDYTADAPQPVVGADGSVNSVQMTWRTSHTPAQACADFRIGMRFMVGTVSDSPAGPGEACRLSADAGRVTAVVTPASPDASGAVIVTTEKRPSHLVP